MGSINRMDTLKTDASLMVDESQQQKGVIDDNYNKSTFNRQKMRTQLEKPNPSNNHSIIIHEQHIDPSKSHHNVTKEEPFSPYGISASEPTSININTTFLNKIDKKVTSVKLQRNAQNFYT